MLRFLSEELDTIDQVQIASNCWDSALLRLQVTACNQTPLSPHIWRDYISLWSSVWQNVASFSPPLLRQCLTLWISALPRLVEEVRHHWIDEHCGSLVMVMVGDAVDLMLVALTGVKSLSPSIQGKLTGEVTACTMVVDAMVARVKLMLSCGCTTLVVQWEAVNLAFEILRRMGMNHAGTPVEAIALELSGCLTLHAAAVAENTTRMLIMSDFSSQKWSSPTRFFGGKVPSHSIALLVVVCANLVRQGSGFGKGPATSLAVAQMLKSALSSVAQFLLHVKPSAARKQHLIVDVMYLLRITRIFRDIYSDCCGTVSPTIPAEIHFLLLTCMALTANFAEDDSAEGEIRDVAAFHSLIWSVAPTNVEEIESASLAQLSLLSPSFLRYVSHAEMSSIRFPVLSTPATVFGCPSKFGATLSDLLPVATP